MSTKIGVITEGSIDYALLPPLLSRIAEEKVGFHWPLDVDDVAELFPIRKRGHGGVLHALRALVRALDTQYYDHACYVILLDRRTRRIQQRVRRLISGRDRFVLGIAIEEVEAWWLGDRTNTLAWSGFDALLLPECRYATRNYQAERDENPKRTLDELTRLSDRFDRSYGEGNLDLATEFAEEYWRAYARLDEIAHQCPQGFGTFQQEVAGQFRRARRRAGRLF